jgi:eukaryotic-like serine/threonine-protein kinase
MTAPLPPEILDAIRVALGAQYSIDRVVGSGAMGSVLLAHDRTLERPVAVKIINPELAATSTFRQRFLQEARTIAKLRHDNIVGVYAAGEAAGVLYFVMEFVGGESLRDLLERDGAIPAARTAEILGELAAALAYAHRNGVIHRDIKPENILIDTASGHARLTDFGIARSLAEAGERVTGTGMSVGTPAYMSPEQASGERDIDGRSDLYSLGLVGYEMLAGSPAFTGKTSGSVIIKQITEMPVPLATQAATAPPLLATVIERSLAKDPAERWPDGDAMARAIEAAMAGDEIAGLGSSARAGGVVHTEVTRGNMSGAAAVPSVRRIPRSVIALLALALLVPIAWVLFRGRSGVPRGVDPRRSYLVVPFRILGGDASSAWLRDGSANMLSLNLAQWRDISVVNFERTLDLLREEELDSAATISLSQARELARRAGAWTLVMGDVTRTGDSLRVTARLFAVETGEQLRRESVQASAPTAADPRKLFDDVANGLLDLVGAPAVELALAKTTLRPIRRLRSPGTSGRWRADGGARTTPTRSATRVMR